MLRDSCLPRHHRTDAVARAASAILVGLALLPLTLAGQARVEGVVRDSLSGNRPVESVLVEILGTSAQSKTDAQGRFVLQDVPAGSYVIQASGPWLDSLGLAPLRADVVVPRRGSRRIALSSPSIRSYRRAACGTSEPPSRGVLRGEVRQPHGPVVDRAVVLALWTEAVFTANGVAQELVASADTTDAGGNYTLCGLPVGIDVLVRVQSSAGQTGDLAIGLSESRPVARFDAIVAESTTTATVRGQVLRADGTPLSTAVVERPGSGVAVRVDSLGGFVLRDVPLRTGQLRVRAIGFSPELRTISPTSSDVELVPFRLGVAPTLLSEVRITAEGPRTLAALEFSERQRRGGALFLDDEARRRQPILSAQVLQSLGTGIRSTGGVSPRLLMRRSAYSSSPCSPVFYADGILVGMPVDAAEELRLFRDAVRVEVHTYATIPMQYPDHSLCGVVLLWTQ